MKISKIFAYELLDSRGNPTVGTEIVLEDGSKGFAISPSGASTGSHEAHEKRDKDANRYYGKGVLDAINGIIKTVKNNVINKDFSSQNEFDDYIIELDNTVNKNNLGANATISLSLSFAKAVARSKNMPLYRFFANNNEISIPTPMMNILNGGAHANNNIDIQEFMIMPVKENISFKERIRIGAEIYHKLGELLKKHCLECGVGDEGGFAPKLQTDEEAIEFILTAIIKSGYTTDEVKLCLDIAASEWYKDGKYIKTKSKEIFTAEKMINYYKNLI
ncbi:MAG: phosphopyruvate hydratase, partial [Alphaproteobacteria bacterium]|nr:phosphopyruvate hydratase [Alphaproteobacteria bacterium]